MPGSLTSSPVSVSRHGAVGDGATLNTDAIQKLIDRCGERGGGTIVFPSGTYLAGELFLKSGVHLHLEEGAVLRASPSIDDYLPEADGVPAGFLFAKNASDISITGPGTIDGNGHHFREKLAQPHDWAEAKKPWGTWCPHFDYRPLKRPRATILFAGCEDIRLEDVAIIDTLHWTLLLLACSKALIRNSSITNPVHGPNSDGIDLDACQDVLVENCRIDTGDDAIALKNKNTWGLKRPSRNITVRGCTLRSPTHGFTIGTETQDDFENVTFEKSTIAPAQGHPTSTGIGLSILDGASIRNVRVSNIRIESPVTPVQIRLGNEGRGQDVKKPGSIEDISLDNITVTGAKGVSLITGLPGHPLRNIRINGFSSKHTGEFPEAGILETVPELESEYPLNTVFKSLPAHGLYCRHVENLSLADLSFESLVPDPRPPIVEVDVSHANRGSRS